MLLPYSSYVIKFNHLPDRNEKEIESLKTTKSNIEVTNMIQQQLNRIEKKRIIFKITVIKKGEVKKGNV